MTNKKTYFIGAILALIILSGIVYSILRGVNAWYGDGNIIEFHRVVTFHSPFTFGKVEQKVIEKITKEIIEVDDSKYVFVRVSHYWPPLGGTNCGNFVNGECTSKLANGERWQEWVGLAIACPTDFEFGTKLKIGDRVWECKDRGGKIQKDGDLYWVDMLTYEALYDYGEIVKAEILK